MSLVSSDACYNCIISGLRKRGMVDMAIEVFIELGEKGLALDMGISMMLIRATFAQTGVEGDMNFVYKLENFGSNMYNSLCDDAICFLCKRGFVEAASEAYIVIRRKGLALTKSSYNFVLKKLINGRKSSLVGPFLNFFLKEYGLVESIVSQIVAHYLCLENIDIALRKSSLVGLFLNFFLKEYGLVESIVSKIVAHYLCLENMDIALRFLKKMKEQVSTVTLPPSVLKKLVKDGRVLDPYKLVLETNENFPV
ncbi:hypothetical protein REPUB_Repub11eG0074200 [Reevesia pubescens]